MPSSCPWWSNTGPPSMPGRHRRSAASSAGLAACSGRPRGRAISPQGPLPGEGWAGSSKPVKKQAMPQCSTQPHNRGQTHACRGSRPALSILPAGRWVPAPRQPARWKQRPCRRSPGIGWGPAAQKGHPLLRSGRPAQQTQRAAAAAHQPAGHSRAGAFRLAFGGARQAARAW